MLFHNFCRVISGSRRYPRFKLTSFISAHSDILFIRNRLKHYFVLAIKGMTYFFYAIYGGDKAPVYSEEYAGV